MPRVEQLVCFDPSIVFSRHQHNPRYALNLVVLQPVPLLFVAATLVIGWGKVSTGKSEKS
jgi:hypothetical protein